MIFPFYVTFSNYVKLNGTRQVLLQDCQTGLEGLLDIKFSLLYTFKQSFSTNFADQNIFMKHPRK